MEGLKESLIVESEKVKEDDESLFNEDDEEVNPPANNEKNNSKFAPAFMTFCIYPASSSAPRIPSSVPTS